MGLSGTLVMFYYSVVIGWIFYYITLSFGTLPSSIPEAEGIYNSLMTQGVGTQIFFHTLAFMITTAVLIRGIED